MRLFVLDLCPFKNETLPHSLKLQPVGFKWLLQEIQLNFLNLDVKSSHNDWCTMTQITLHLDLYSGLYTHTQLICEKQTQVYL